ncbi:MAG: acyltransferase [Gammaproteobacteria bacterium]|nr:MAG: acyltransferase [Gammaproteobacteria bacterium]
MILKPIAKCILKLTGWTSTGQVPDLDKAIFIAAPHTTNWDAFWLIVYKVSMDVKLRFLAKHTLFWWPLGSLLSWFGAMPLDRGSASSTVQQMVDAFEKEDHLFLALAPEGTRKWKPYWKTGFYQISLAANVPIVFAYIDYSSKKMGIGPALIPGGDIDQDMAVIRKFYEPFVPRHPALRGPVEFPPDREQQ